MIIEQNKELQRSLIKAYWKRARRVLKQTTQPIIAMSKEMQPETLKMMVGGLNNNEFIRTYIIELWGNVGSRFATDLNSQLDGLSKEDIMWEEMFRNYMFERSLLKANSILSTQQAEINRIIDVVVSEGGREGWSIERISEEITRQLERDLTAIQSYHAERIARTEVIGASNKGSFDAAERSGLGMKKQWITSGLKGIRDSHLFYQSQGLVSTDYEYNVGLKYPGDPNGGADEVINCRCSIVYSAE